MQCVIVVHLFLPGGGTIGKHLVHMDAKYAALFNDAVWKEMVADKMDSSARFGS